VLFPYQYLANHPMETMQEYVQFIIEDVWCEAIHGQAYDIDILFAAKPQLMNMIKDLDTQDPEGADKFLTSLHSLFEKFKELTDVQKREFKGWFIVNNNIDQLCTSGDTSHPATYQVIEQKYPHADYPGLLTELKRFYKNLYSADFLTLKSVKKRIGNIDNHYDLFTQLNDRDVCPFCGLSGMLNHYHDKREAYDHYFPKGKYPFNSINFKNLVPACTHCNSSFKTIKNPLLDSKDPLQMPRKVFYPFTTQPHNINLTVDITHKNWENLTPEDVTIVYGPDAARQEVETWKDVYDIDDRYRIECCSKGAGKAWLTEVLDLWKIRGKEPAEYLADFEISWLNDRFVEKRFLKKEFLEGCQRAGLFE